MSLADEARTVRQRLAARLRELEPRVREYESLVREYNELKQVAEEMGLEEGELETPAPAPVPERQQPATRRARRSRTTTANRRSSPPAEPEPTTGDELAERVLDAVRSDPGKAVADYAAALELPAASLYRTVRELTNAGTLVKRARHLFPS